MKEITNALITATTLDFTGIMTAWIHLDYGGSGQGFGGYGLDSYDEIKKERVAHKACGFFIMRVLETVGAEKWEDLPGKYVRVEKDWGKVYRIGNILEDKWFNPEAEFKEIIGAKS